MNEYENELAALKRSGRYRERRIFDEAMVDLASNDYLGLAEKPELLDAALEKLAPYRAHAPKASMLVNGYHPLHKAFETALCEANGFEDAIVMGSGFNANIAMIEALVRRGDTLFVDEKYHASGLLAAKLVGGTVVRFAHNDTADLAQKLDTAPAKRRIIAVEGIYSMDGDLVHREIFDIAERYDALLVVDEAHSSGVVGERLLGVFDLYGITPRQNHLKMGTLGKAYGSFGAYVLASSHITEYLVNRAKPVIYATAPSLIDTALGHTSLEYILANVPTLQTAIAKRQELVTTHFDIAMDGLIAAIPVGDNRKVMEIQKALMNKNILVGAIRQPTVEKAIVRLIGRVAVEERLLTVTCREIRQVQ